MTTTKIDPNGNNKAENLIALAEHHARNTTGWKSSAEVGINDAIELLKAGDYEGACRRALHSLEYSIGILHEDYIKAKAAVSFADVPQYPEPGIDEPIKVADAEPPAPGFKIPAPPVSFGPEQDRIDRESLGRGMSIQMSESGVVVRDVVATFDGVPIGPVASALRTVAAPQPVDADPIDKVKAPVEYGTIEEVRKQIAALFTGYKIEVVEAGGGAAAGEYLRYNMIVSFGNPSTYSTPGAPGMDRGDYVRGFSYRRFDAQYVMMIAEAIGRIDEYHATITALRRLLQQYDMLVDGVERQSSKHAVKTAIGAVPLRGWQVLPLKK